ncbi:MAG: hypothetical protein EBS30_03060 [Planctomycetes bacterium]|nr:hypothetical protein [Planctomycetota bacterium]
MCVFTAASSWFLFDQVRSTAVALRAKGNAAASALMGAAILLGPILEEIVQHRHASRNEEEEERRQKIRPIKPSRDEECL